MPGLKDHLEHSKKKYPKIKEEKQKKIHQWMDNPTGWTILDEYKDIPPKKRKEYAKKKKRSNKRIQRESSED